MMDISINGVTIAPAQIATEVQNHPASSPEVAWQAASHALAVRELLVQAARERGIEAPEGGKTDASGVMRAEEDMLIDALLAREISVPEADEATCRRYFENNRGRFRSPDLFEAAHILLAARPADETAYAAACNRAAELITILLKQPKVFATLAREHSACSSATHGGALGQVARGETVPELETFLFELEPGQLCPVPVKTRFGAHVLRLDRRIDGCDLPFEAAQARITDYLQDACWRRAVAQYISLLAGRAEIDGIDLGGVATPLVQ